MGRHRPTVDQPTVDRHRRWSRQAAERPAARYQSLSGHVQTTRIQDSNPAAPALVITKCDAQ